MRFAFCIIERETQKDESNDSTFVCKSVCPQELSMKCTKQEKKYVNNDNDPLRPMRRLRVTAIIEE
jgi:hypothetical protein